MKFKSINPDSKKQKQTTTKQQTKNPSVAAHLRGRSKLISVGSRSIWFTQGVEVSQGCTMRSYPHPQQQRPSWKVTNTLLPLLKVFPNFLLWIKLVFIRAYEAPCDLTFINSSRSSPRPHLHTTAVSAASLLFSESLQLLTPLPKKCCHWAFPPSI